MFYLFHFFIKIHTIIFEFICWAESVDWITVAIVLVFELVANGTTKKKRGYGLEILWEWYCKSPINKIILF
jgi:hypothetical protein